MYNSIWVMLHKFSGFSMFFKRLLLDFASCMCVSSGWGKTLFKASQGVLTDGAGCHLSCPWDKVPPSPEVPLGHSQKSSFGAPLRGAAMRDAGAAAFPQHRGPEMQGVSLECVTPAQSPARTLRSGS